MNVIARITKLLICLYCALTFSTVHAASVSFDQTSISITNPLSVFSLDLLIDFSDTPTSGGAVDVTWDTSVLQYNNDFAFNPLFDSPDAFFDVIDFQEPGLLSIGFGTTGALISDNTVAGTLGFTYLGGTTSLDLQDSIKWAGFFDTDGADIPVNYTPTSIVPLPAAFWLMLTGLAALGVSARRKKPA